MSTFVELVKLCYNKSLRIYFNDVHCQVTDETLYCVIGNVLP